MNIITKCILSRVENLQKMLTRHSSYAPLDMGILRVLYYCKNYICLHAGNIMCMYKVGLRNIKPNIPADDSLYFLASTVTICIYPVVVLGLVF